MSTKNPHTTAPSTTIPYGKQQISEADIEAVVRALKSDFLTLGPLVTQFEEKLAEYCGSKYAVVFSSGTAALHAACAAADLKVGDEAITSSVSFVASANCARFCGADVRFADIDAPTAQVTAEALAEKITAKTKILIPVDLCGRPSELDKILKLAKEKNLIVIEDAAHSLGASYKTGSSFIKVGSSQHADMAILSFHPVKAITTCEGGAVTTNSKDYYEKLIRFRTHGITKNQDKFINKEFAHNAWCYEMQELGYNYRISDIQCALGISQLKSIDEKVARRREIVNTYKSELKDTVDFLDSDDASHQSAHHIVPILVNPNKRDTLMKKLAEHKIGTQLHYMPIYRQHYYKKLYNISPSNFPQAEKYFHSAISIPLFPTLKDSEIEFIVKTIKNLVR